jgi:long-chain acyl-CoA synthetase
MKTVLLTGATGFLGTQIARYLLADENVAILALVRDKSPHAALLRLRRNWWDWPELISALNSRRVEVICGEIIQPNLGLTDKKYAELTQRVTHVIHTAADWRFLPLETLRKTNVEGTRNLLEFAKTVNQHHRFERFSHVSTAYVAGGRMGIVPEDALTDAYGFFTNYERSKYEGELLVQAAQNEFAVSVFRPSMIVGDSETGAIKTFNTFYFPLRLYLTGRMRLMPVKRSLKVNVVPVDYVAKAVAQLTFNSGAEGKTFHLVAPQETLPTIEELIDAVQAWAKTNLNVNLPKPLYFSMSASNLRSFIKLQRSLKMGNPRVFDALISLAPYFSENKQFQRTNIDALLGHYVMDWRKMLPRLLEYATYYNFFHRSDRTVHEQIMFRLESQSYPITFYDVVDGELLPVSAEEVRKEVLAAAAALKAMGIGKGDRVALTGLNCTKYLAIDIAIGIVGAVSVPLYYTSPAPDVDQILEASGAKLLFIGIPGLLKRVDELKTDIPIVYFTRTTASSNRKNLFSWTDFISQATSSLTDYTAPVDFGDVATLRYSSGTTGKPKGAIFKHENLLYMAESIVAIAPWVARNRKGTYLSFLPMGHVVEGILATYSPYYFPSAVDLYFLEDFRKLQETLPKARPTIFFGVPRLYEKIWEAMTKHRIGSFYIHQKPGALKRLLAKLLKGIILKRAGLNRCAQLIVGSANSEERMLQNFRQLGVEIHNAYGLTEAPLVTMNRLGRNRIGTVGEPMPQTEIRIAEDGEIMIHGPQVTVGYFEGHHAHPIRNGWLMTGDIGKITDEGSLVIFGRKKEVIKTAYGKCIYSGKIEGLLREISGVSEVLLVGESKPYCGALMWVPKEKWTPEIQTKIDAAVEEANKGLSNPEQIKRWALLKYNLSIETGELTPNLKLKRNTLIERHEKVIGALYGGVVPEGDAHYGGAEKAE